MIHDRPIGEIFNDGGVILKVVQCELYCSGCYYFNEEQEICTTNMSICGRCAATHRKDKKDVNFIKQ